MREQRENFLNKGEPDTPMERIRYALEVVRNRYPLMTVGAFLTFLNISKWSENRIITLTQLAERQKVPLTTVFRQCDQLSDGLPGKPGMKLIEKTPSPEDGRARVVRLSFRGITLLTELYDIIEPRDDDD